jgi:hypothetical protein
MRNVKPELDGSAVDLLGDDDVKEKKPRGGDKGIATGRGFYSSTSQLDPSRFFTGTTQYISHQVLPLS